MKRVQIIISGKVQGVFFRTFIKETAEKLNLTGYVMNKKDKKVESIAEGNELKIKKFIEKCKKGPEGSKVEKVGVKNLQYTGEFKEFKIKY